MASTGTIIQVIGSTFDAQFPEADLPNIYNAVKCEIDLQGTKTTLVGEVAKHLGGGQVRCVALASTDGLRRGDDCAEVGRLSLVEERALVRSRPDVCVDHVVAMSDQLGNDVLACPP